MARKSYKRLRNTVYRYGFEKDAPRSPDGPLSMSDFDGSASLVDSEDPILRSLIALIEWQEDSDKPPTEADIEIAIHAVIRLGYDEIATAELFEDHTASALAR